MFTISVRPRRMWVWTSRPWTAPSPFAISLSIGWLDSRAQSFGGFKVKVLNNAEHVRGFRGPLRFRIPLPDDFGSVKRFSSSLELLIPLKTRKKWSLRLKHKYFERNWGWIKSSSIFLPVILWNHFCVKQFDNNTICLLVSLTTVVVVESIRIAMVRRLS